MRDTLENWQSEFLQLIWQVVALTYLWYIGSPQSKRRRKKPRNVRMDNEKYRPPKSRRVYARA